MTSIGGLPDLRDVSISIESSKVNQALEQIVKVIEGLLDKNNQLEHTVSELKITLGNHDDEIKRLRDLLNAKTDVSGIHDRLRAIESLNVEGKFDQINRLSDQMPDVLRRVDGCEKSVAEIRVEQVQATALSNRAMEGTTELSEKFKDLLKDWKDNLSDIEDLRNRLKELDAYCKDVSASQTRLLREVENRYEKLWQDVLSALDRMNFSGLKSLEKELLSRCSDSEARVKRLISMATSQMAEAMHNHKKETLKRKVILAWREEAWQEARRKKSVERLRDLFLKRERGGFDVWRRNISLQRVIDNLKSEYESKIPVVEDEAWKTLGPKLEEFDKRLTDVESEKDKLKEANELFNSMKSENDIKNQHTDSIILDIQSKLDKLHDNIIPRTELLESMNTDTQSKLEDLREKLVALQTEVGGCARENEVKEMLKDILLLWNSVKQLDSSKADRKELEAFAAVSSEAAKSLRTDVDELLDRFREIVDGPLSSLINGELQSQIGDLNDANDKLHQRTRLLNHMLTVMLHFLEDLLAHVATNNNMGGNKTSKYGGGNGWSTGSTNFALPPMPKIAIRTGGGYQIDDGRNIVLNNKSNVVGNEDSYVNNGSARESVLHSRNNGIDNGTFPHVYHSDHNGDGQFDTEVGNTLLAMEDWVNQARQSLSSANSNQMPNNNNNNLLSNSLRLKSPMTTAHEKLRQASNSVRGGPNNKIGGVAASGARILVGSHPTSSSSSNLNVGRPGSATRARGNLQGSSDLMTRGNKGMDVMLVGRKGWDGNNSNDQSRD